MSAHGVKRKNRREETVLTRMRIGHTGLNKTLFLIGKSGTDGCECGKTESVEHVLMECERYTEERTRLADQLQRAGRVWSLGGIMGTAGEGVPLAQKAVIEYLKKTGLYKRILYLYSLTLPLFSHPLIYFFCLFIYLFIFPF